MENRWLIGAGIALFGLLTALIGFLAGGMAVLLWSRGNEADRSAESRPYTLDPHLVNQLAEIRQKTESLAENFSALAGQTEEMRKQLETLAGNTAQTAPGKALRDSLPPSYVEKVEKFFQSGNPKTLLSPPAARDPSVVFGRPIFIAPDLITIPYKLSNNYHYLLVKVAVEEDLHELHFDVLWDSLAGQ